MTAWAARLTTNGTTLASVHQCPHCDEALAIRQNKIVAGENPTVLQARIDDMQKDWDVADAVLNKLTETTKPLNAKLRQLEQDIKDQESRVSICRRESKATGDCANRSGPGGVGAGGTGG